MITVQLEQFQQVFSDLCKNKTKCLMLFTSQKDENGKYWCPNCEKIVPYYEDIEKQAKQNNVKIYRFLVGDADTWGDPDHKYKNIPVFKFSTVPTLGVFDGEKLKNYLDGDQMMQKKQRDLMFQFKDK